MKGFQPSFSVPTSLQIDGAEALLGVRFPSSYRTVISEFNGAIGGANFPVLDEKSGGGIGMWLSILPCDTESVWSTLSSWREHGLPPQLIPFGDDGGGNYVCLDYRHSDVPAVVVWYHEIDGEAGIYPVVPTFDEFLAILHEDDV